MSVTVVDNPMDSRYEARVDDTLAGVSEYELTVDTIVFLHTRSPSGMRVRGSARQSRDMRLMTHEPGASTYARSARLSGAGWHAIPSTTTSSRPPDSYRRELGMDIHRFGG